MTENTQNVFFNHSRIKLEINNKKEISPKKINKCQKAHEKMLNIIIRKRKSKPQ